MLSLINNALLFTLLIAAAAGCSGPADTPPQVAANKSAVDKSAAVPAPTGPGRDAPSATENVAPTQSASASGRFPDFTSLVKREGPAVVNVSTVRTVGSAQGQTGPAPDDPLAEFRRRFMPNLPGQQATPREGPRARAQGLGSGFVIRKDGYILTNAHVVADAEAVTVRLADGKREFPAKVIGIDRRTDVALIKIDATDLPTVTIGRSTDVQVGEWVAAIGSPFGFANTITAGIVSATGRNLPDETFVPFIQTDVAVNPGNSGGPLLNLKGEVIGINSMIYSQTGGYMGVSFAIPIDVAMQIGDQLRTEGKVTRGRLGVQIQAVTEDLAKSFGLDSARGVLVAGVEKGGPADRAGLRAGDIVLRYNDQPIAQASDLPRSVASTKPGLLIPVVVLRTGKEETLSVTVGAMAAEEIAPAKRAATAAQPADKLGLVVAELSAAERAALNVEYGLRVEGVEGPAADTQIRPGDVVVAVNEIPLKSRDQFREIVRASISKGVVALLVRRGEATLFIPVKVG